MYVLSVTEYKLYLHIIIIAWYLTSYPNNPNGVCRSPLVKNQYHVIRDMVYYWPMYTDTNLTISEPIMIFSRWRNLFINVFQCDLLVHCLHVCFSLYSSKHEGLAGTRFGWGLYQDSSLAQKVASVIDIFVLGVSVDVELRVLASLQAILSNVYTYTVHVLFCLWHSLCSLALNQNTCFHDTFWGSLSNYLLYPAHALKNL